MVVYTGTVYNHTINTADALALSGNIVILSVFYCFVGTLLSFILHYIFTDYRPAEKSGMEWEKKNILLQLADVAIEIAIIALVSFWLVFSINTSAPIIPVPRHFAPFVDTYTTGMFFMFAVFIFLHALTNKLKYIYKSQLSGLFDSIFTTRGFV